MLLFSRQEYTVNRLFNLRRTYSIGAFWVGREMVVVVVMVVGVGWGFGEERRGEEQIMEVGGRSLFDLLISRGGWLLERRA